MTTMRSIMRTGKFYFKNEKELLKSLGFKPVSGSGSSWIAKEDGTTENFMCQLKSTDAHSYRLDRLDIDKLEYHAAVEHKIPIFITQFLEDGKVYFTINAEDIQNFVNVLAGNKELCIFSDFHEKVKPKKVKTKQTKIQSDVDSRERFYKERERQWQK